MSPSETGPGQGKDTEEVTQLLAYWNTVDPAARDRVMAALYPELKRIAQLRMRSERSDHTLQPSALVNEFFLQFALNRKVGWRNREHFLATASRAMRRILVDYSRAHRAEKRGGGSLKLPVDELNLKAEEPWADLVEISDVLDRLADEEPRMAKVVELKCFAGLTNHEIADILKVDERTVKRDWQAARAWLYAQLKS